MKKVENPLTEAEANEILSRAKYWKEVRERGDSQILIDEAAEMWPKFGKTNFLKLLEFVAWQRTSNDGKKVGA
jgi:hypothetical protein